MTRFQIQSWKAADPCTCEIGRPTETVGHLTGCRYPTTTRSWVPMENGPAKSTWKPRRTPQEAVAKAAVWSGAIYGLGVPAMQVVDLSSGVVVWRSSEYYPDAGRPVRPAWTDQLYAAIKAHAHDDVDDATTPVPVEPEAVLF